MTARTFSNGTWRPTMHATRFTELAYVSHGRADWRFCDPRDAYITFGPTYTSKAELLGDLTRYAAEYGAQVAS